MAFAPYLSGVWLPRPFFNGDAWGSIDAAIERRAYELMAADERSGAVKVTDQEKALVYWRGRAKAELMTSAAARELAAKLRSEDEFDEIAAMRSEFGGE